MTKLVFYISFLFCGVFTTSTLAAPYSNEHEAYLSVTTMNYNSVANTMECEMKVTAHDLEKAIRIIYKKPFDLDKEDWRSSNSNLLLKYLMLKLDLKTGADELDIELIGYEIELTDEVWLYFQFKLPENQSFDYNNKLLTELYSMQQNVTHVNFSVCEKSFVFTKYSNAQTFNCNE